jgi:hypothetical protein
MFGDGLPLTGRLDGEHGAAAVRCVPHVRAGPVPVSEVRSSLGFSTGAVQTPERVNVTWVTPLGEEAASTW